MLLQLLFLAALLHFGESQNQCVAEIQSLKTDLRTQLRQDVQELVEDKATKRDVQALKQKLSVGHQLIMDALASNVTKLVQELTSDRATDAGNHTVADGSQQCMTKEEVQTMIRSEVEIVVRSEVKDIIQLKSKLSFEQRCNPSSVLLLKCNKTVQLYFCTHSSLKDLCKAFCRYQWKYFLQEQNKILFTRARIFLEAVLPDITGYNPTVDQLDSSTVI